LKLLKLLIFSNILCENTGKYLEGVSLMLAREYGECAPYATTTLPHPFARAAQGGTVSANGEIDPDYMLVFVI
jgi:hypothetical protein